MERELIIKNLTNINTNLGKCIEMMNMTMTQNDQYILTIKRNEIKEPTIKKQASLSIVKKESKEKLECNHKIIEEQKDRIKKAQTEIKSIETTLSQLCNMYSIIQEMKIIYMNEIDAAEKAIRKEERDILDSYEKIIYNMQKQFQLTIKKMEKETIDITSSFELIRKLNLIGLNYQQIQRIERECKKEFINILLLSNSKEMNPSLFMETVLNKQNIFIFIEDKNNYVYSLYISCIITKYFNGTNGSLTTNLINDEQGFILRFNKKNDNSWFRYQSPGGKQLVIEYRGNSFSICARYYQIYYDMTIRYHNFKLTAEVSSAISTSTTKFDVERIVVLQMN